MTRDDVIRMAQESADASNWKPGLGNIHVLGYMERFAALVAAAEREACAKLCEGVAKVCAASSVGKQMQGCVSAANGCAELIRTRGKA